MLVVFVPGFRMGKELFKGSTMVGTVARPSHGSTDSPRNIFGYIYPVVVNYVSIVILVYMRPFYRSFRW